MSTCHFTKGLEETSERPEMPESDRVKCYQGLWWMFVIFAFTMLAMLSALASGDFKKGGEVEEVSMTVDGHRLSLIKTLPNVSFFISSPGGESTGATKMAGAEMAERPVLFLAEDFQFQQLFTPEVVEFGDIETGVSVMARWVADPSTLSIAPELKTFWAPLLNSNKVHHIFRDQAGHRELHSTPPTDVSIYEVVSMLYYVANHGNELKVTSTSTEHAACSLNLGGILVVQTSVQGSLSTAWIEGRNQSLLTLRDRAVDRALVIKCIKIYQEDLGLSYVCGGKIWKIEM